MKIFDFKKPRSDETAGRRNEILEGIQTYQNSDKLSSFEDLKAFYRKAYIHKKKCEALLKEATAICNQARDDLVKMTGEEEYEDDTMSLSQVKRIGSVDWKLFESTYPQIKLDPFRKESTFFWTIKLKIQE